MKMLDLVDLAIWMGCNFVLYFVLKGHLDLDKSDASWVSVAIMCCTTIYVKFNQWKNLIAGS